MRQLSDPRTNQMGILATNHDQGSVFEVGLLQEYSQFYFVFDRDIFSLKLKVYLPILVDRINGKHKQRTSLVDDVQSSVQSQYLESNGNLLLGFRTLVIKDRTLKYGLDD